MKKVLIAGTILSVVTLAGCSDDAVNTPSTRDLINPEHSYGLNNPDFNGEIYEFTPKSNKNKTCVLVKAYRATGLQCFDKVTENTKK